MTISLKDKVAIVTGGTRGIGYAIVRAMVEAGAKVAIWGSRQETADAAVAKIKLEYPDCNVMGMAPKITDSKEVGNAMNAVVQKYGTIDILANNAGSDVTATIEIYAHGICNVFNLGTFNFHLNLFLILLVGKNHLAYCDIRRLIAFNVLCFDSKRAGLIH